MHPPLGGGADGRSCSYSGLSLGWRGVPRICGVVENAEHTSGSQLAKASGCGGGAVRWLRWLRCDPSWQSLSSDTDGPRSARRRSCRCALRCACSRRPRVPVSRGGVRSLRSPPPLPRMDGVRTDDGGISIPSTDGR